MTLTFFKLSSNIRLGELLVHAGILTKAQLTEATRHAGMKRLQIGQVLVMHGYLSAHDLQSALVAQSMIRDKSIDAKQAIKLLKIAYKSGASFDDMVRGHDSSAHLKLATGKLGELLMDAGVIKSEQLLTAMDRSLTTGLPLGRTLVLDRAISEDLLKQALDIQVRLRDEMLTREESLQALRVAAGLADDLEAAGSRMAAPVRRGIRLGELLVVSGLLNETQVMNALEWGLVNSEPIGKVLVAKGEATQELIDAALQVQKLIEEGTLTPIQAGECLANIGSSSMTLEMALELIKEKAASSKSSLGYRQLLALARVASHEDIAAAMDQVLEEPEKLGRLLTITGYIDEDVFNATLQCHKLLAEAAITQDDAVVALDYCLRKRPVDFEGALRELGWTPATPGPDAPQTTEVAISEEEPEEPVAEEGLIEKRQPRPSDVTLAPEDARARELSSLIKLETTPGGILERSAKGELSGVVYNSYARLADSYIEQGDYPQAQVVYERILVLRLNELGTNNAQLIPDLRNLAAVLCTQGKFEQSEPFARRALAIEEKEQSDPLALADALTFLASVYLRQDKLAECEPLLKRALEIQEKHLPPDDMHISDTLSDFARLLHKTNRNAQAEVMYERARAIAAKHTDDDEADGDEGSTVDGGTT